MTGEDDVVLGKPYRIRRKRFHLLTPEEHRRLLSCEDALTVLVDLKDGPRDDAYRKSRKIAWNRARAALGRLR